jgi:multidrug resistance efflux pump
MSEQSPNQSSIDVFVEWAKARLDEMAADAKVLESRLDKFDASLRRQAEQAVTQVNDWIAEGQAKIKEVQAKGEAALADGQGYIEATWAKFQTEADRWVELTKNQQAVFEARARAQAQAWQNVVNTYVQRASEVHAQNQAQVEAQVEQLKANAQKAQAELNAKVGDLSKAGQASWVAMSQALDESRNAFAKAIEITAKKFNEATKG